MDISLVLRFVPQILYAAYHRTSYVRSHIFKMTRFLRPCYRFSLFHFVRSAFKSVRRYVIKKDRFGGKVKSAIGVIQCRFASKKLLKSVWKLHDC